MDFLEAMENEVYCPSKKTIDMGRRRVTDVRVNKRIMLPDPRPPGEEATLMARRGRILETAERYIKKNCNGKGAPLFHLKE